MDATQWQNSERGDEMLFELSKLKDAELEAVREPLTLLLRQIAEDVVVGYCVRIPDEMGAEVMPKEHVEAIQAWAEGGRDRGKPKTKLTGTIPVAHNDLKWALAFGTSVQDLEDDNDLRKALKKLKADAPPVKAHGVANLLRMSIPVWPGKE